MQSMTSRIRCYLHFTTLSRAMLQLFLSSKRLPQCLMVRTNPRDPVPHFIPRQEPPNRCLYIQRCEIVPCCKSGGSTKLRGSLNHALVNVVLLVYRKRLPSCLSRQSMEHFQEMDLAATVGQIYSHNERHDINSSHTDSCKA